MNANWTNYFFHTDFTPSADGLVGIEVADEISLDQRMALASILTATDKGEGKELWVIEGNDKEWNLSEARVTYNGKNSNDFATNSKYSHVLILAFPDECVTPRGKLYLQYNVGV